MVHRRRGRSRLSIGIGVFLILGSAVPASGALAEGEGRLPDAFRRPARETDRLPTSAVTMFSPHSSTRLVVRSVSQGVVWRIYAATTPSASSPDDVPKLCELVMRGNSDLGTGCTSGGVDAEGRDVFDQATDPSRIDFTELDAAHASLVYGIAANAATRVGALTRGGRRLTLPLSRDLTIGPMRSTLGSFVSAPSSSSSMARCGASIPTTRTGLSFSTIVASPFCAALTITLAIRVSMRPALSFATVSGWFVGISLSQRRPCHSHNSGQKEHPKP